MGVTSCVVALLLWGAPDVPTFRSLDPVLDAGTAPSCSMLVALAGFSRVDGAAFNAATRSVRLTPGTGADDAALRFLDFVGAGTRRFATGSLPDAGLRGFGGEDVAFDAPAALVP